MFELCITKFANILSSGSIYSTYDTIIWFDNSVLLKRLEIVCTLYQYEKNFMTKLQAANKHKTNVMKPEKTKYMERYHINLHQLEL
jgi:hypothetical protein